MAAASNSNGTTPAHNLTLECDPWLFGVLAIPAEVTRHPSWTEWRCMLLSLEDGDLSLTADDVDPVLQVYLSLRRRGVVFMPYVAQTLDPLCRSMQEARPDHL